MEFLLIIVVFLAIFWFMSRGQRKQQQKMQDQIANLEPGTWVMTTTGFYGRFIDMDGDVAILETADGTETYWVRQALRGPQIPPFAQDDDVDDSTDTTLDDDAATIDDDNRDSNETSTVASDIDNDLTDEADGDRESDRPHASTDPEPADAAPHSAVELDDSDFGKKGDDA